MILHRNTVSDNLWDALILLMSEDLLFFEKANDDFDPICLRNHYWELIKLDFEEKVQSEFNK
jgi:hypothetical protein